MPANVDYETPAYAAMSPRWDVINDCIEGASAIKKERTKYLPIPGSDKTSEEALKRYADYLERAIFYNVTRRTLQGLIGQVFKIPPVHDNFPELLKPLLKNVDGNNISLNQQAQKALIYIIALGRTGLWADYPDVKESVSMKQLEEGEIRPTISLFPPQSIINWRTVRIGNYNKLSLVVIKEQGIDPENSDDFKTEYRDQYRVLRLTDNGEYKVELWVKDEGNGFEPLEEWFPREKDGKPFTSIPFEFIGAENNSPDVDQPPIEDIALINVGHYRNSADYEESVFFIGQPTYYFTGVTEEWINTELKGTINVGARGGVPLPGGETAGILQAQPNSLAFEAMNKKEEQMLALGARLVQLPNVERTATEVTLEYAGETSQLALAATNVSDAYEKVLKYAHKFIVAGDKEIEYQLNKDYNIRYMDSNERAQLVAEWQAGAITEEEMRKELEKNGTAILSYEEFKAEMAKNPAPNELRRQEDKAMQEKQFNQKNQQSQGDD